MADSMQNFDDEPGNAEWFLELDNSAEEPSISNLSQVQPLNNSTWDTDSGYEPSPAYFNIDPNVSIFQYPTIEDVEDEDEFDDVFLEDSPASSSEMSSTPRSSAIPIPPRRESTPAEEDLEDQFEDEVAPIRPQSCPLLEPEFELDSGDFLDFENELDDIVENFQTHSSVSTQTEWMFDEEIGMTYRRRVSSNVPDVVPRRNQRSNLPRRAASFNQVDYVSVGTELLRLSDSWEHTRRMQRRAALERRRQTFLEFVMNAILSAKKPRRPRIPPTLAD